MGITAACQNGWPEAVTWSVAFLAVAIGYAAWRFTGGRHIGEKTSVYPPPSPPPPPRKDD